MSLTGHSLAHRRSEQSESLLAELTNADYWMRLEQDRYHEIKPLVLQLVGSNPDRRKCGLQEFYVQWDEMVVRVNGRIVTLPVLRELVKRTDAA